MLTVNGIGFASGDEIAIWGPTGESFGQSTTFVSSTQLQTTVPASFVSSNATLEVWVNTYTCCGSFASTNQLPLAVGTVGPILSIAKTHSGNFVQGQQNAAYTVTVSNASGAGQTIGAGNQVIAPRPNGSKIAGNAPSFSPATPTSGQVTVNEFVPFGMTLVSMAGTGWSCSGTSCMRSDVLPGEQVIQLLR